MAKKRKIKPEPERHKRGRWVMPILLIISVLLSFYFWSN